jgi:hypothetical protein
MSWTRADVSQSARFLADPLTFMQSNLLIVNFEGAPRDTGDAPLDLVLYSLPPTRVIGKKLGVPLGVYFIAEASMLRYSPGAVAAGPSFKAYFCPYRKDDTLGTVISNKADLMFTAAMDGCSLGIGSAGPSGSRLIYHANTASLGSESDPKAQGAAQNTTLKLMFGGTGIDRIWGPENYRFEMGQGSLRSTSFGVRSTGSGVWNFYSQVYTLGETPMPQTYYLREVKTVL